MERIFATEMKEEHLLSVEVLLLSLLCWIFMKDYRDILVIIAMDITGYCDGYYRLL